jgi:hypothetical protein
LGRMPRRNGARMWPTRSMVAMRVHHLLEYGQDIPRKLRTL